MAPGFRSALPLVKSTSPSVNTNPANHSPQLCLQQVELPLQLCGLLPRACSGYVRRTFFITRLIDHHFLSAARSTLCDASSFSPPGRAAAAPPV